MTAAVCAARAAAQEAGSPITLPRLSGEVTLDGVVGEAAWIAVAPLPLTQYLPVPGGPIRQASEIRLAYDERFLYAAGRFTVPPGARLRANSLIRDVYAEDDYLNLIIDTFNDRESAVWFVATPAGTRIDGAISNDAEGPESQWNHPEYDLNWDAVTSRSPDGWSIEVRIPLSSLRFQPRHGKVAMGIIAARLISEGKERYIFPAIRPTRAVAHFKPSLAARVILEDLAAPRMRAVSPFLVFGTELRPAAAAQDGVFERRTVRSVGGDLKFGLSSRFTLDLTANTDFAQAEADDQQINLERFSLFFPEKRQFFLERSGVFDFSTGGDDRLFYSRRIGLREDGRPARVLGGGRIVGRIGAWDLGVLDILTTDDDVRSAQNNAVLRLRRSLGSGGSYVGAIGTTARGSPSDASRSAGVDATLRISEHDYLVWSAALTSDTVQMGSLANRSALRGAWERRRRVGLHLSTAVTRIGEHYAPALGYVRRPGTLTIEQLTRHAWETETGSIREQSIALSSTLSRHLVSALTETVALESAWSATTTNAAQANAFIRVRRETLADTFYIDRRIGVPPGTFTFGEAGMTVATPPGSLARISVGIQGGRFYDGERVSVAASPVWNASSHVELGADVEVNRIWRNGELFRGDLVRLRGRFSYNTRASLSGLVQYNRAAGTLTTSLRFRHSWREGTDLYIVVNDGRSDERRNAIGLPSLGRAQYIAAKYVHTLR